ncbi:hypothetical protein PR001_g12484 [Phytophthora rubi]|nr:hypothetical protein PR002_g12411 [Phytophthora rubi]KAE9025254.1 hypothetical protein PR001_g12484 [Phytophthora rubi]
MHGEAASVSPAAVREAQMAMQDITRFYELKDIWNMDETGHVYRAAKDRAICKSGQPGLKKDKTRITLALAANADGSERREPLIIGRAKRPHCFKGKDGSDLGFDYTRNRKAWMTKALYTDWIRALDADMRVADRDILLLVDNASSHDLVGGELTNVTVQKLPPNTTSHVQPMDAGIIAAFKSGYRDLHLQLAVDRVDRDSPEQTPEGKNIYWVDQLQAMRWSNEVWSSISATTIANCFRHAGVVFSGPKEKVPPTCRQQVQISDLLV